MIKHIIGITALMILAFDIGIPLMVLGVVAIVFIISNTFPKFGN